MTAIIRQSVIFRRFKYMPRRVFNDEFSKYSETILPIPAVHPSQEKEGRQYVRLGGIICYPTEQIYVSKFKKFMEKYKKILYKKTRPNGNDDKEKSDLIKQRDQEVNKLQELRQRTLEHEYQNESVWKAMKERDELLRRTPNDKERNDGKSENDDSK